MKITKDIKEKDTIIFSSIAYGSVFEIDGEYYIKNCEYNYCTNLKTGSLVDLSITQLVKLCDAELIIKGYL